MKVSIEDRAAWMMKVVPAIPPFKREHVFHPTRKWRFDFAWPEQLIALEVEGISREGTRHQRIGGFKKDIEKYLAANALGWNVIRTDQASVKSGKFLDAVEGCLARAK